MKVKRNMREIKGKIMKEKLKRLGKRYFIDAMGAMALGLFASLLIGTIFGTVADLIQKNTTIEALLWIAQALATIAQYAKAATGMAIGVAIAYKLGAKPLVVFSCAAVGAMSNAMGAVILDGSIAAWAVTSKVTDGIFYSAGPAGAFFAVIIAAEIGQMVAGKTKVDILVTPVVTLITGFAASWLLCPLVSYIMYYLGVFIATATTFQPLLMGIVVSVVVGMILTLPISSAAICAMIFSTSALEAAVANGTSEGFLLAGGAATVGCCAQMVGFAVMSFRVNRWGGLVSQGLGTSMLQMPNICRKPQVWIAPTLASAVVGPLSTMLFKLECTGVSAGMGTCGMVGPIGVVSQMGYDNTMMWIGIALLCIVLPAVLSLVFSLIMEKLGWYTKDDLKLAD